MYPKNIHNKFDDLTYDIQITALTEAIIPGRGIEVESDCGADPHETPHTNCSGMMVFEGG